MGNKDKHWSIIFIEDWQTNKEDDIINLLQGGY